MQAQKEEWEHVLVVVVVVMRDLIQKIQVETLAAKDKALETELADMKAKMSYIDISPLESRTHIGERTSRVLARKDIVSPFIP